jgi:hypothetical protein
MPFRVQRKRTKRKGSRPLVPLSAESPVLLINKAASESRGVYTPLRGAPPKLYSFFIPLPGCVKWQKQTDISTPYGRLPF